MNLPVEPAATRPVSRDEVDEVLSLLGRDDPAARHLGLAMIDEWDPYDIAPDAADRVVASLDCALVPVGGAGSDPAEFLLEALWERPDLIDPDLVVSVFPKCRDRIRLRLVALLAMQGTDTGLDAIVALLGPAAAGDRVPQPRVSVLGPLIDHPDRDRVIRLCLDLLDRSAWARLGAELLVEAAVTAPMNPDVLDDVVRRVQASAVALVDECDRVAVTHPRSGDLARSERRTLELLVSVIDLLADVESGPPSLWWRMLASADPRVATLGAVRLVRSGEPVAADRLRLLTRDPVARVGLHEGLAGIDDAFVPDELDQLRGYIDHVGVAEGRLVQWLSDPLELGREPDEIEFVATLWERELDPRSDTDVSEARFSFGHDTSDDALGLSDDVSDGEGPDGPQMEPVQLFRFRLHAPHWSSARGWMIGASSSSLASSCYRAEDELDRAGHVHAIREALADWPESQRE